MKIFKVKLKRTLQQKEREYMKDYSVKFYDQDYMLLADIIKAESLEDLKVSADSKAKTLMDENGVNEITWTASEVVLEGKVME
ncbi:hypothetical protein [Bacillus sp. J14]|uniref:hypothetical protein n=2 Tax=Bacillaceae TaxID=186817 RepID=UPI003BA09BC1